MNVSIVQLPDDFSRWDELHRLIAEAFAYMDGIVDPESSAKRMTVETLKQKLRDEQCFLAVDGDRLIGCVFCAVRADCLYVGKLAVARVHQRSGIGRLLIERAERLAAELGLQQLELQTRVELIGNHAAFGRLGFVEAARTAHAGYDRPTSLTLRKAL